MKRTLLTFLIMTSTMVLIFAAVDQKTVEYWQKTMKYGVSGQRQAVLKSIEDNKATEAYSLIQDALLQDPNPDIRGNAAYSLIKLKSGDDSLWLKSIGTETNSDVLRKVVFAISELKIKTAGPKLYEKLTNIIDNPKETQLSAVIVRSLGGIGYQASGDYILSVLSNIETSAEIRGAAAIALGDIGSSKYIPALKSLLENVGELKEVRMYSAFAIGKTGDKQAIGILSPYIENEIEDINVRLYSIAGFGYLKDPTVIQKLISFLKTDNVRVRLEAVKALGNLKDSSAVEILTYKALYDPELAVKREAKKALQDMGIDVENLGKTSTTNTITTNNAANTTNITNKQKDTQKSSSSVSAGMTNRNTLNQNSKPGK